MPLCPLRSLGISTIRLRLLSAVLELTEVHQHNSLLNTLSSRPPAGSPLYKVLGPQWLELQLCPSQHHSSTERLLRLQTLIGSQRTTASLPHRERQLSIRVKVPCHSNSSVTRRSTGTRPIKALHSRNREVRLDPVEQELLRQLLATRRPTMQPVGSLARAPVRVLHNDSGNMMEATTILATMSTLARQLNKLPHLAVEQLHLHSQPSLSQGSEPRSRLNETCRVTSQIADRVLLHLRLNPVATRVLYRKSRHRLRVEVVNNSSSTWRKRIRTSYRSKPLLVEVDNRLRRRLNRGSSNQSHAPKPRIHNSSSNGNNRTIKGVTMSTTTTMLERPAKRRCQPMHRPVDDEHSHGVDRAQ